MQKPELISFKLCPFVQRAVIALKYKQVDFDLQYIHLANPPIWFKEISPLGKVPLLRVEGEVLFESSVINEYLDEVYMPMMHPVDPLLRAKNRAWIAFASELLITMMAVFTVKTEQEFNEKKATLQKELLRLEAVLEGKSFFNGDNFSLVDTSFAPFFMRIQFIEAVFSLDLYTHTPKINSWQKTLLDMEIVQQSVVDNCDTLYIEFIKAKQGYLAAYL